MNPSTLIGMIASVALVALMLFFSAEDPSLFLDLPSLAIVLGGTLAGTFLSYPLKEVVRVFGLIGTVLRHERTYAHDDIDELVRIYRMWLRGEVQAVEQALKGVRNPYLRSGVQMVIDRVPEADIIDLLHWRIAQLRAREAAEAQLFRVMAAYAPAFGMIGTLVGLVNLMGVLGSGDLQTIGRHLGVALITTFYGILLANLVFKPVAVKLERRTDQRVALMNMVMQGISMMSAGRSPSLMRETLRSFVATYKNEIHDEEVATPGLPGAAKDR